MPYISEGDRKDLEPLTMRIESVYVDSPGILNFIVTKTLMQYEKCNGINYKTYNDMVGVLECAKLELYRRMVVPYEDNKIAENGDVY